MKFRCPASETDSPLLVQNFIRDVIRTPLSSVTITDDLRLTMDGHASETAGAVRLLPGQLRNFMRSESSVKERDFIKSAFPVGIIVASASQEKLIEADREVIVRFSFNFLLSIQINGDRLSTSDKDDVLPLPPWNGGGSRDGLCRITAAEVDQFA